MKRTSILIWHSNGLEKQNLLASELKKEDWEKESEV
jgi:hypothetical protein